MQAPRFVRLFAALMLFLLATACGDDSDGGGGGDAGDELSDADQEYVDAAMETYDSETDPFTEDEARCVAESVVRPLGADRLQELGVTPDDFRGDTEALPDGLDDDEANEVVDGIDGCINLSDLFMQELTADQSLSEESTKCLRDAFDDDFVRRIVVTMLTEGEDALQDDEDLTAELMGVFSECPQVLGELQG